MDEGQTEADAATSQEFETTLKLLPLSATANFDSCRKFAFSNWKQCSLTGAYQKTHFVPIFSSGKETIFAFIFSWSCPTNPESTFTMVVLVLRSTRSWVQQVRILKDSTSRILCCSLHNYSPPRRQQRSRKKSSSRPTVPSLRRKSTVELVGGYQFKNPATGGIFAGVAPLSFNETSDDNSSNNEAEAKTTPASRGKEWMVNLGIPSLVPEWAKMLRPETLFTDVSAGLTVGCVAVPLSLAIAVASGVPAEVGLVTAAVSGVAGGLMGGTTLAVTGPAAAISLLVVGAVQEHGLEALPFITLACGGMQLASGVTRLGVAAKLVPVSVIAGFTMGVGTMILTGQIPKALGLAAPAGLNPMETLSFIAQSATAINPASAALAVGTALAMYSLPKLHPKIPSALLAVGGATVATHTFGLDVSLIGSIPSGLKAFQFGLPSLPSVDSLPSLAATTFLIYAMTSAESLLSCVALEKMRKTSYKHNSDQELIGQGIANMSSAMFMGMPVTSVIARSSLNARLNANTRLPALVQAGFVFSSVVFMSDTISMIPMPALSGMLITTGLGMLSPKEFQHCFAVQKLDAVPFFTTIGGMITFGLAEGIGIGCLSALALNYDYGKLSVSEIHLAHKSEGEAKELVQNEMNEYDLQYDVMDPTHGSSRTKAWHLDGPINFGAMFVLDDLLHQIAARESDLSKPVILNMHGITSVEFTGVEELVNRLNEIAEETGISIELHNCPPELEQAVRMCGPAVTISTLCQDSSKAAPYIFPEPIEEVHEPTPYWYDSPNFRPYGDDDKRQ